MRRAFAGVAAGWLAIVAWQSAFGNAGPFITRYPAGDSSAEGALARLDPSLKPARETRLRVIEENLSFSLADLEKEFWSKGLPPALKVAAQYTIENPTTASVSIDFGFPVLRGDAEHHGGGEVVTVDGVASSSRSIHNELIYAMIRQRAREAIDKGIAADAKLTALVAPLRPPEPDIKPEEYEGFAWRPPAGPRVSRAGAAPRAALAEYLTKTLNWNARDAALLVEYATINFGPKSKQSYDRWFAELASKSDLDLQDLSGDNLGLLWHIGKQKATQFFAHLADKFDHHATAEYEGIFRAWGGDLRERSLDLSTGNVRLREYELPRDKSARSGAENDDPTVYARLEYLDTYGLKASEKNACRNVLKNLPVTFSFAPMSLIHYQVSFPPKSRRNVVVRYTQFAYADTRDPASHQFSYVLHPASLWQDFGPIRISVSLPEGVKARASVAWTPSASGQTSASGGPSNPDAVIYRATLTEPHQKTGELFLAVDKAGFKSWAQSKFEAKAKANTKDAARTPILSLDDLR